MSSGRDQQSLPLCLQIRHYVQANPPKLMILAAFGIGKLGDLYFVEKNSKMNTLMYKGVLQRHLKCSMKNTGCHIFVQDGALCLTACSIKAWFVEQDVRVLDRQEGLEEARQGHCLPHQAHQLHAH